MGYSTRIQDALSHPASGRHARQHAAAPVFVVSLLFMAIVFLVDLSTPAEYEQA
jgi:hypothetical protein